MTMPPAESRLPEGWVDLHHARCPLAGTTETGANGINGTGQIVGSYCNASGNHGFLKEGSTYTAFDVPFAGATGTEASGINGTGQIVGAYVNASGGHSFLKDGSTYTTLDVPGASATGALGINGTGQIVGTYAMPALFTASSLPPSSPSPLPWCWAQLPFWSAWATGGVAAGVPSPEPAD